MNIKPSDYAITGGSIKVGATIYQPGNERQFFLALSKMDDQKRASALFQHARSEGTIQKIEQDEASGPIRLGNRTLTQASGHDNLPGQEVSGTENAEQTEPSSTPSNDEVEDEQKADAPKQKPKAKAPQTVASQKADENEDEQPEQVELKLNHKGGGHYEILDEQGNVVDTSSGGKDDAEKLKAELEAELSPGS